MEMFCLINITKEAHSVLPTTMHNPEELEPDSIYIYICFMQEINSPSSLSCVLSNRPNMVITRVAF